MKFFLPIVVAVLAPLALGQSLSDIPTCAQSCVASGLASTGCGAIDVKCFCSASSFISHISCCIKAACSDSDQAKTIKFASDICSTVSVTVPTDINSVCSAATGTQSSPSSTGSSNGTATSTSKPTGSVSVGTTATPTTGAAAQFVASGLGLVGAAAAALALL